MTPSPLLRRRIVKSKPRYDPDWAPETLVVLRSMLQKRPTKEFVAVMRAWSEKKEKLEEEAQRESGEVLPPAQGFHVYNK